MNHPSKMQYHLIKIFIFILTLIFYDGCEALGKGTLAGGWKPIPDVTNPLVVDIGKFAVDEHDKKNHATLKFRKVVSGKSQVVAGMDYNLTIMAVNGGLVLNYVAVVWDKPGQKFRQLVSFKGPI
ncbi:cysteine proteinase inhibitor A [Lactuca sativa]|uniref:cysteine proteinase inhibitor A n=1 Tax=Lactuca sativa TaxID=4236 RepID=UPI000CA6FB4E|nr:cysteine proteinase inhibitor A [Lactuca sativa]